MLRNKTSLVLLCKRTLFLASFFLSIPLFGQDSLFKIFNDLHRADTIRLQAINTLMKQELDVDLDSTISLAHLQLEMAQKTKQEKYVGNAYLNIGNAFDSKGNSAKALEYYGLALHVFEKLKYKKGIGSCYSNMGIVYEKMSEYAKAFDYASRALKLKEEINDLVGIGRSYNLIGNLFIDQFDYDRAMEFFLKALHTFEEAKSDQGIISSYTNIGNTLNYKSEYSKALPYYVKGLKLAERLRDRAQAGTCVGNIGGTYFHLADYPKALNYFFKSLNYSKELGLTQEIAIDFNNISAAYSNLLDFKRAIIYADSALVITKQMGDIENEAKAYSTLALSNAAIGNFKVAYTNQLLFKELTDTLVARDKSKDIGKLEAKLEFDEQQKEQLAEQKKRDLETELVLQKKNFLIYWLTGASVILFLSIGFIYLFFRQGKLKNEQRVLQMEQKLLRSQMNPHFIFNCLGVIRSLIQKNESTRAESYLTKFSKLVRSILENSRIDAVSLQSEIESLQNYLEMQRLMFNQDFDYSINVDEGLDKENILIPSMLAQPFIENSLKHGLAHKSGKGMITVNFKRGKDALLFEAIDNGVGLEKSGEFKEENNTHNSLATIITKERLSLLNKNKRTAITLNVTELVDKQNEAKGTAVSFHIPYQLAN